MKDRNRLQYRRAGTEKARLPRAPFADRWYGKLALLLLSVAMLTFSFAPFDQFYLAWVGLVPWLLVLRRVGSQRAAFLWFWLAGVVYFTANMWWLVYVTGPGMVALMVMLGLFWGVAAVLIRGTGLLWPDTPLFGRRSKSGDPDEPSPSSLRPLACVLLIATVWTSIEWVRGNYPLKGLPWLFLGHAQTPALALCQVADLAGVYGVTFWLAAVNALLAFFVVNRFHITRLVPATVATVALVFAVGAYGVFRLSEQTTSPGPTVLVVQPNYPQSNTGEKGAPVTEVVDFHVNTTDRALSMVGARKVDLVVWSETMMPPLNRETREAFFGSRWGEFIEQTDARLRRLTARHATSLLAGGTYEGKWALRGDEPVPADRRNVAYFYQSNGILSAERYDKVHIVPFGEYLPFKDAFPPLHGLFVALSPYPSEYFLQPGSDDRLTVFRLDVPGQDQEWRFVAPICFEDIDPALVAKMFRGPDGTKRADFIVNITNDGWFRANEMPQHLQAAVFRSIENRAPTARSVNTGISGFIDSSGRKHDLLPVHVEGTSDATLQLDSRYTVYTRVGDAFAVGCAALTGLMAILALVRWWGRRRARRAAQA